MGAEFDEEGNLINDSKYKFTPIGKTNKFYGDFDGENNYITNLYINETTNYVGLFGKFFGTSVKNLTVKNSYIKSTGLVVGIIGGNNGERKLSITNVHSINNVINSNGYVAGIIGQVINANIEYCTNSSKISATTMIAGGIVGLSREITLNNNINNGDVTAGSYSVGGIAGNVRKSILNNNVNYGTVQGETKWIGGIAGINSGESSGMSIVSNNINEGKVTTLHGGFRVAGIVGNANNNILLYNNINKGDVDAIGDGTASSYGAGGIVGTIGNNLGEGTYYPSYLLNCYNEGNVKGDLSAGGIAGNLYDETYSGKIVSNVYNLGTVESTNGYAGGIIGKMNDHNTLELSLPTFVTNSYNNGIIKGKYASGLIGANVGISNSINYISPQGENNFGVIGHTNGDEKIENVYYINTVNSSIGTSKTESELNNDFVKTILGTTSWDYSENYPKLYKVEASIADGNLNVNYLTDVLK